MMVFFTHPDDQNVAFFPKVIVVMGLTLTVTNILLLPLDVGSRNSEFGGLPMDVIWLCVQILMGVLIFLIIPFSYFYYSNYEPYSKKKPIRKAIEALIIIFVIFVTLCGVGYIFLGVAEVPIQVQEVNAVVPANRVPQPNDCPECKFTRENGLADGSIYKDTIQNFPISFVLFVLTVIAVLGWLLFVLFAGIGLIALPQQLIQNFKWRPRPIDDSEWRERKIYLGTRAAQMIQKAKEYQKKRPWRSEFNRFKKEVYELDDEFKYTRSAHDLKGKHIIFYIICLIGGIAGIIMSIMWFIHIVIFNIFRIYPFLNLFFLELDGAVAFFGTAFFGLFSFYLLWAVIEGNLKFGLRIPFLFAIHPIKKAETYMDAWLFNTGLIMLASVGVSHFLSLSFTVYARLTANNAIYNLAIYNLRGLKYLWGSGVGAFLWAIVGLMLISFVYFALRPVGSRQKLKKTRAKRFRKKYEMKPLNN
jgi:LMBR1 domain-containing protein 1